MLPTLLVFETKRSPLELKARSVGLLNPVLANIDAIPTGVIFVIVPLFALLTTYKLPLLSNLSPSGLTSPLAKVPRSVPLDEYLSILPKEKLDTYRSPLLSNASPMGPSRFVLAKTELVPPLVNFVIILPDAAYKLPLPSNTSPSTPESPANVLIGVPLLENSFIWPLPISPTYNVWLCTYEVGRNPQSAIPMERVKQFRVVTEYKIYFPSFGLII